MASMNSDIRIRNRNQAKVAAIIVGVAAVTLSLAFGLSFLPSFASAHVAVISPTTVEEGGTLRVVITTDDISGDFNTGDTVKGVLWGFTDSSVTQCTDITDVVVPGISDEFFVTAPSTDGLHTFYYKLTSNDDCTGTIGALQSETDSFEVLPDETPVMTSTVVYPADLALNLGDVLSNVNKWFFYNDETGSVDGAEGINNAVGSMVVGPGTAPAGVGSAQISVPNEGALAHNARRDIATYQFKSIKLSTIKNLTFSTYSQSAGNGGSDTRAPYLNFNVSFDGTDTWQKRLAYVPNLNGTVTPDTWQTWDAADPTSKWTYSGATWPAPNAAVSGQTPLTLAQILTDYPNIQTRASDSWFGFRVGEPYADGFTGNVDNFSMTVKVGVNTTITKYDFEPTPAPVAPACDNNSTFDLFNLGTVNGQGGWGVTGAYDQSVVSNTYGFLTFGCQSLRISNSFASGSFGDQTFSPSVANEAGESTASSSAMSSGTRQNHYEAQFDIASAVPGAQQTGLVMSVSPDRGDGARMGYVRFEDQADGIHIFADDYIDVAPLGTLAAPADGCGLGDDWSDDDIATLDRTQAHTVKVTIDFVDGPANDVLKVYVDGVLKHTGTTWEDYFRWCTESGGGVADDTSADVSRTVDSLLFRIGGSSVPANAGKGFLIDNVSVTTGTPDPVCSAGQHLDNHICVNDTTGGGSSNTGSGSNGGGGAPPSGPLSIGFVNTNPTTGGLVLGTSTEALPEGCELYISSYLKQGNTGEQVKKLQVFLNTAVSAGLPVTGVFGPLTFKAVQAFQLAHWDEVLAPWVKFGLPSDHTATGYVYKTTQRMINLVQCNNAITIPQPQLP